MPPVSLRARQSACNLSKTFRRFIQDYFNILKIIENTKIQKFSVFSIFRQKKSVPNYHAYLYKKETIFKDRSRQLVQNFCPVRLVWVGWSGSLVRFVGSVRWFGWSGSLVRWFGWSWFGLGRTKAEPRPTKNFQHRTRTKPDQRKNRWFSNTGFRYQKTGFVKNRFQRFCS